MNKLTADYYFTKLSKIDGEYDKHDIVKKLKMDVHPSDMTLGDNIDVFISKYEFPPDMKPKEHDLLFLTDPIRFYEVTHVDDSIDLYIINLNTYKY